MAEGLKHCAAPNGHWENELGVKLPSEHQDLPAAAGSYVWAVRVAAYYHVFFGPGLLLHLQAQWVRLLQTGQLDGSCAELSLRLGAG